MSRAPAASLRRAPKAAEMSRGGAARTRASPSSGCSPRSGDTPALEIYKFLQQESLPSAGEVGCVLAISVPFST